MANENFRGDYYVKSHRDLKIAIKDKRTYVQEAEQQLESMNQRSADLMNEIRKSRLAKLHLDGEVLGAKLRVGEYSKDEKKLFKRVNDLEGSVRGTEKKLNDQDKLRGSLLSSFEEETERLSKTFIATRNGFETSEMELEINALFESNQAIRLDLENIQNSLLELKKKIIPSDANCSLINTVEETKKLYENDIKKEKAFCSAIDSEIEDYTSIQLDLLKEIDSLTNSQPKTILQTTKLNPRRSVDADYRGYRK